MIKCIYTILLFFSLIFSSFAQTESSKKGSLSIEIDGGIGLNFTLADFVGSETFSKTPTFGSSLLYNFAEKPIGIINGLRYNQFRLTGLKMHFIAYETLLNIEAGGKLKFVCKVGLSHNFLISHNFDSSFTTRKRQDYDETSRKYQVGLVGGFGLNYYVPKKHIIGVNIIYSNLIGDAFSQTFDRNTSIITTRYHLSGVNIVLRYSFIIF